jgi:hypothetical protein
MMNVHEVFEDTIYGAKSWAERNPKHEIVFDIVLQVEDDGLYSTWYGGAPGAAAFEDDDSQIAVARFTSEELIESEVEAMLERLQAIIEKAA